MRISRNAFLTFRGGALQLSRLRKARDPPVGDGLVVGKLLAQSVINLERFLVPLQ